MSPTTEVPHRGGRYTHAEAILSPELCGRLADTKVLLVGAGGIGCELLKNVVLTGFGHITLLDLDTIDLSNLNRQFLFRKKDIKQSKAMVAAQTAGAFNPNVHIYPIHANIKEPQFDIEWFRGFDIVLNALDNLDARRHVNKMCMAAGIPLVESGTAGYLGQAQPLLKDRTECFDCVLKPTPKSFPVCTIRSTPSQPIHCIVWAKSYLLPPSVKHCAPAETTHDAAKTVFQKVFHDDILNLLSMSDMWRSRAAPTPLDFHAIENSLFRYSRAFRSRTQQLAVSTGTIDQRALSLQDNLALFVSSTNRLAARLRAGEETISFDKDDDDTLDFVTAASNLRSAAYYIERKTRWEVKEMAGNIIPAIATTNAIVSGLIVLQALHILRKSYGALKNVHLQFKPSVPLSTVNLCPPNPKCAICRDTYTTVLCDPTNVTLGEIIDGILVSVYEDKRILSDPDWDDNLERTLESLNVTRGKFLTIVDEEGEVGKYCSRIEPNHPADAPCSAVSRKRSAPDDEIEESGTLKQTAEDKWHDHLYHRWVVPSKKRRLEDEGLVMLSGATDGVDDEVIVID
ncbi:hypothetical protein EV401DRAFT_2150106 [Pisolithus croceorrhizus]|nr:hypothetical protein EV401DRAFT_2150106 [Pisolithus croceorrhizus]